MTVDDLAQQQADLIIRATALASALDAFIARVRVDTSVNRIRAPEVLRHADQMLSDLDRHLKVLEALYDQEHAEDSDGTDSNDAPNT